MNKVPTSTYLQNKNPYTFNILDSLSIKLTVTENPYHLPLEVLFDMAARKNKKRGFLFVSKVLGKHIPVKPAASLLSGGMLAMRYMEEVHGVSCSKRENIIDRLISGQGEREAYLSMLKEPFQLSDETLFIGFAETATALGHNMFEFFDNAAFVHTTRENIRELESIINFEEEHSHATSQACYCREELLQRGGPIVLVDDEITTGNTALNIIKAIQQSFPRKEYTVASLLDWRSEDNKKRYEELEKELGITIKTVTLLAGEIEVQGNPVEDEGAYLYVKDERAADPQVNRISLSSISKKIQDLPLTFISSKGEAAHVLYSGMTGRFSGLLSENNADIDSFCRMAGERLLQTRTEGKALCLGTGEFMYLPMKIADYMGDNLFYQSTTRSPIHRVNKTGYAVKSGFAFPCPEDDCIMNYFYNIEYKQYADIFLFLERAIDEEKLAPLLECLKQIGPETITLVTVN
ncbi:TRSP domain C terminus to PRTase_2 [Bacillus sp. OV322]|nr:TRSP domain C terminus to PRTase_2 [Bacillus sp. OV322]